MKKKTKKLPKCFWLDNLGICAYGLESNGVPCKGKCPWYVNKNYNVSPDYPIITEGNGFSGMKEEDYD